jgi:hypothetical protein
MSCIPTRVIGTVNSTTIELRKGGRHLRMKRIVAAGLARRCAATSLASKKPNGLGGAIDC